jgi:hypothetical protein
VYLPYFVEAIVSVFVAIIFGDVPVNFVNGVSSAAGTGIVKKKRFQREKNVHQHPSGP